jgi:hypothetical protein
MRFVQITSSAVGHFARERPMLRPSLAARLFVSAAALVLIAGPDARADVVFDSLDPPAINQGWGIAESFPIAHGFLMGPATMSLSTVEMFMFNSLGAGNFYVGLYGDDGSGLPGAQIQLLNGSTNPSTAGIYTYTGSAMLTANTNYWIVAGVSSGPGSYTWGGTAPPNPSVGTSLGVSQYFSSTWNGPYTFADTQMRVTATVPEASAFLVTAVAASLAGAAAWKSRRAGK